MSLMCLAMNAQLSTAEFQECSRQVMRNQERLLTQTLECASLLPAEQRLQYLVTMLPVVLAL